MFHLKPRHVLTSHFHRRRAFHLPIHSHRRALSHPPKNQATHASSHSHCHRRYQAFEAKLHKALLSAHLSYPHHQQSPHHQPMMTNPLYHLSHQVLQEQLPIFHLQMQQMQQMRFPFRFCLHLHRQKTFQEVQAQIHYIEAFCPHSDLNQAKSRPRALLQESCSASPCPAYHSPPTTSWKHPELPNPTT